MLMNVTVALLLSKVRSISWYLGVGLCCLRVKDQCNSGTNLVPEYLLKTSVICKAESHCLYQYDFSQVWSSSPAVVWKQML